MVSPRMGQNSRSLGWVGKVGTGTLAWALSSTARNKNLPAQELTHNGIRSKTPIFLSSPFERFVITALKMLLDCLP